MRISLLFLAGMLLLTSCTKVINVDLNSSSPQYVIEGSVTDAPGPYSVHITRSVNFSEESIYPAVDNALVTIADNGATDTLRYIGGGYYATQHLTGVPGHSYALQIMVDGVSFSATDVMPQPVAIDSLYTQESNRPGKNKSAVPVPLYRDPAGIANYYHFILSLNGSPLKNLFTRSDLLTDGQVVNRTLEARDTTFKSGDRLSVEMQSISKPVYDYYISLSQTIGQNSATPANPATNIAGKGALGFFSAHAVRKKDVVVP